METFNKIRPLAPTLPARARVQNVPYRKPREDRPAPQSDQSAPEEQEDSNDGKPHIDEYA